MPRKVSAILQQNEPNSTPAQGNQISCSRPVVARPFKEATLLPARKYANKADEAFESKNRRKLMRTLILALLSASVAALALPSPGNPGELRQIGTMSIPGEALDSFDISFVDQKTNRYFLADRSNKAIDVFDVKGSAFIGRATGFV